MSVRVTSSFFCSIFFYILIYMFPLVIYIPSRSNAVLLLWICFVFILCLSLPLMMSVSCSLVVTCLERPGHLAHLYVKFSCAFVIFTYGVLVQMWYLIVSILDLCLHSFFVNCSLAPNFVCKYFGIDATLKTLHQGFDKNKLAN